MYQKFRFCFMITLIALLAISFAATAGADVKKVRFVSVAWTGVTIKTELSCAILNSLGYEADYLPVSVPIVYKALATDEADVFLGNWMPSMMSIAQPYFDKKEVIQYVANMPGAKYTLAVPKYVADAGIVHFKDLDSNKDKFEGGRIYGIEEGNDGNEIIEGMIKKDLFGLGDWEILPSSEPAMLSQVMAFAKEKKFIVFLAWSPHPMNKNIDMTYLLGSTEDTFGPNDGSATIYTNLRPGFADANPNLALFFKQLIFPIPMMNDIMDILHKNKSMKAGEAALEWIKGHPEIYKPWLKEVKTLDGKKGALEVFEAYLKTLS